MCRCTFEALDLLNVSRWIIIIFFKRLLSVCVAVVQLMELHQQRADMVLQDAAGCTLLHHAVEAGSKEILKYLIDNGDSIKILQFCNRLLNWTAFGPLRRLSLSFLPLFL